MVFFRKHVFSALVCCLVLASCSSPKVQVSKFLVNETASPKSVAILPFTLEESIQEKRKRIPPYYFPGSFL